MKKLLVLALVFTSLCSITVSGQEHRKNLIAGGFNFSDEFPFSEIIIRPGLSLEYERMLNIEFSLGLEIGTNMTLLPYAEIQGRWYPWYEKFFVGLGLGVMNIHTFSPVNHITIFPVISPEVGWKFNIRYTDWAVLVSASDRIYPHAYFESLYLNILEFGFKIGRTF